MAAQAKSINHEAPAFFFALFALAIGAARADDPEVEYVRRIMMPEGHSFGIRYAAEPTAPALFVTTKEFYTLDLATGTFGDLHPWDKLSSRSNVTSVTFSPGIGVEGDLTLAYAINPSLQIYDSSTGLYHNVGLIGQSASIFYQASSDTFYSAFGKKISAFHVDFNYYPASPEILGPTTIYQSALGSTSSVLNVSGNVATVLMPNVNGGTSDYIERVDLTTNTLINSFSLTGTIANSMTVDSEGNIYVGDDAGGAKVYDTSGALVTSLTPDENNNPADPNVGTNVANLFINTAGQLVVTDTTGMHQYLVYTPAHVSSAADSGAGTLRQAVSDVANGVRSAKYAKFDAAFDTPQTITLTSSLDTLDMVFSLAPQSLLTVDSGANTFLDLAGSGLVYQMANVRSVSTSADAIKVRNGAILSAAETFAFDHLTLDNGTLRTSGTFASGGAIALGAGGGTFDVASGTTTLSGVISGDSILTKTGAGQLTLGGVNTHTGGTQINGGVLAVGADAALGTGQLGLDAGTVRNLADLITTRNVTLGAGGGTFDVSDGYFTINGNVSGTGGLTKTGGNILTLAGAHTYTGATTVNGGILKFTANGPTASTVATSSLAIASGAKVIFSDSQIYAGSVTGAGVLEHEFSGTTVLTGTASHTGGTNIIGGTIQIGNGGNTGSLGGNVALSGGGKLAFNRSDDVAFSGTITGNGGLIKLGSGELTLLVDSSYTGGTTVTAGQLLVEGNLTGTGLVNVTGGAIGGDGEIGGSLHFDLGAGIVFDATSTLTIDGATVTFDGFSVANVIGLDSTVALGTYTLLDGPATFDFTNVANLGAGNAYDLGGGKSAYFQSGSLDLIVVPEPSTWTLLALGAGVLVWRRRRSFVLNQG